MSTYEERLLGCPRCQTARPRSAAVSLNAARRPELRDEILAGQFHRFVCEACGASFLLETELTYLDVERGQFLVVFEPSALRQAPACVAAAQALFERTMAGPEAAPAARAIAARLQLRVCFGLAAFREKVLCAARGLDDIAIEILKLRLLARGQEPLGGGVTLRLVEAEAEALRFSWTHREAPLVEVPRAQLDEGLTPGYAALRERLAGSSFVDALAMTAGGPPPADD